MTFAVRCQRTSSSTALFLPPVAPFSMSLHASHLASQNHPGCGKNDPTPRDPPTDSTSSDRPTYLKQQVRQSPQDRRYNAAVGSGRAAGSSEPPPTPGPRPFPAFFGCPPPPPRRPIKAPPSRVTTRSPKARRTTHDRLGIVNVLPAGVTSCATSAREMHSGRGRGNYGGVAASRCGELAKQSIQRRSTSR